MKILTIKKRTIVVVLSVILALVTVIATAATVITVTRSDNGITIVIDAGHGGADGGVLGSATGAKESDINLAISKALMKYFKDAGYNVIMTRSDMGAVCSGRYIKREDMRARRTILESASPDLVISIHCNSYPQESVNGAQVFFSADGTVGKTYAQSVQSYFNDLLNTRPRTAAIGDYYILNCSKYPSILCECGFLSNGEEESKLITTSYQEKVAYTIFSAINSVFFDKA